MVSCYCSSTNCIKSKNMQNTFTKGHNTRQTFQNIHTKGRFCLEKYDFSKLDDNQWHNANLHVLSNDADFVFIKDTFDDPHYFDAIFFWHKKTTSNTFPYFHSLTCLYFHSSSLTFSNL